MTAASSSFEPATDATPVPITLRFDVIERRATELGIDSNDGALAEYLGINRVTIWRYRGQVMTPNLDTAMRIAERLNLSVEEVVVRGTATARSAS